MGNNIDLRKLRSTMVMVEVDVKQRRKKDEMQLLSELYRIQATGKSEEK